MAARAPLRINARDNGHPFAVMTHLTSPNGGADDDGSIDPSASIRHDRSWCDVPADTPNPATPERTVSRGMRTLLYALTALTFIAGTQLVVLGEHTATFFAWAIDPPLSAAFIGAGFWSASTVVFWCARQRDWARARVIVPTVAVVASMLLVATLQHLELFQGLFGLAWIEIDDHDDLARARDGGLARVP